jgi:hypothetical protein
MAFSWLRVAAFILLSLPPTTQAHAQSDQRLSFSLASDQADRMAQLMIGGQLHVYVEGPIAPGDTDRFLSFVRSQNLEAAQIVLNSPGGSLLEGVKLGRAIRAKGFDTSIGSKASSLDNPLPGVCASACAYAFAGGVLRFMSGDEDRLGLHQFASAGGEKLSEGDVQLLSGMLVAYLSEMGVDANAFALASTGEPHGIIWLDAEEAHTIGFVNNGVLPTEAEIRMVDMRPYLWIGQSKPGVDLRAILICWNRSIALEAALVTNEEQSANWADPEWVKRSYLEFDGHETLAQPGQSGVKAEGNSVWLSRALTPQHIAALAATDDLGIWLDGFGMLRVGGYLDLKPVHPQIRDYVSQCHAQPVPE